nr:nitrilase-related carbon-nitrogen hydrolase [Burkholderia ambifaria]
MRIGLLIRYDSEFPESGRALAALGAQLILVTDGNMEPYRQVHRTSVSARAMENQAFAVVANRVGGSTHDVVFAGGSLAADPFGNLMFEAGHGESRHTVELGLDQVAASRAVYDHRADQRLHITGKRIEHADGRRELLIPSPRT